LHHKPTVNRLRGPYNDYIITFSFPMIFTPLKGSLNEMRLNSLVRLASVGSIKKIQDIPLIK